MNKEELLRNLENINFSKLESQIYLALLEGGAMSAYQLAKKIEISRSSIYNTLEHMYEKGMVEMIPESTALYVAQRPDILIERMKKDFSRSSDSLSKGLEDFMKTRKEERYKNFKGFETVIYEAKQLMRECETEIYINADFDLHVFEEEFQFLKEKGIKVYVFSFPKLPIDDLPVEQYTHGMPFQKNEDPSRLMVTVDQTAVLLADRYKERDEWTGVVTNNSLMVSVATEHIHNDIYLLQLQKRDDVHHFWRNIGIESLFEGRIMCTERELEKND